MAREKYEEFQKKLVGSLLYKDEELTQVLEHVSEEAIENPRLQVIFRAMAALARQSIHVSPVSVGEHLEKLGELKAVGGMPTLHKLATSGKQWTMDATPLFYALSVKEASIKVKAERDLQDRLGTFAEDSGVLAADALAEVGASLNNLMMGMSDTSTISHMSDSFEPYMKRLEERRLRSEANREGATGLQGIPTMWPTLNEATTGWLPGQMITVGARTGIGKSVVAVDCAIAAAAAGKSVMFFSLEMSREDVEDRIFAATTSIPINRLRGGELKAEELATLREAHEDFSTMKLTIDVEPKVTVDSIRARALKQAQSEMGLDFIIIDYLQLIQPVGKFNSRQEAVADISRNVKLLAKQLEIPIMVLVQLNRTKDDDEDALPRLEHIRETHAIAQDSDIVLLIHRNNATSTEEATIPHTLLILAKQRNGVAPRFINCLSLLECSLLREVPRAKDIEGDLTNDFEGGFGEEPDLSTFDGAALEDASIGRGALEDTGPVDEIAELDSLDDDFDPWAGADLGADDDFGGF